MGDQAPDVPNEPNARPPWNAPNRKKRTATIPRGSSLQHEAESSMADHSTTISTESHTTRHPGQQNGNVPGASFEPAGVLERAPRGDEVHTFSPARPEVPSKPRKPLRQTKIVHSPPNQARIAVLCDQEQKTVAVDGGNTDSSQLRVLSSIEGLPFVSGANRIWTERTQPIGRDKRRKTVYHCSQQGCGHQDSTAQKARQHFVASHVEGAGWECPIDKCPHTRIHKRLDDLKNHHMVPQHDTKYFRGRESSGSLSHSLATLGTGTAHPYSSQASNSRTQDQQIGPHRTNAGSDARRARNAHRLTGPLNMNLRSRRNTNTSTAAAEQEESRSHAPDILHPSRIQSPMPEELNYRTSVNAIAFSPPIAPIEGTSRFTPILAGDFYQHSNEPPSTFSPTTSHRSLFNDTAVRQSPSLTQGRHPSVQPFNDRYGMEGSSPAPNTSMLPQYPRPGSHVSSYSHDFPTQHAYNEDPARMQRRDGQPGHDPPVQDAPTDQADPINTMLSNLDSFPFVTGSPHDRWRHQQQYMVPGGAPGTSSDLHLSPPRVETPRSYVADSNILQPHPNSWTSYPFEGNNFHDYGQPSTSYQAPRRLPNLSTSIHGDYGYPSNQVPSPFYGAFPFPSPQATASPDRADEWPPYDESNFNPDRDNFNDYEPRREAH